MITANLITNESYQTIRLPKEFEFTGVNQVAIRKHGNAIIITPLRKSWKSFAGLPQADTDFLSERPDILDFDGVMF